MRDAGVTRWDSYSPYPIHGMERAMGIRYTRLPWIVFGCGVTGAVVALLMQWWTNAVDYPFNISGKPIFSLPANIPVTFELIILFSAFAAFLGALVLNGLPRFNNPLFQAARSFAASRRIGSSSVLKRRIRCSTKRGCESCLKRPSAISIEQVYDAADARPRFRGLPFGGRGRVCAWPSSRRCGSPRIAAPSPMCRGFTRCRTWTSSRNICPGRVVVV